MILVEDPIIQTFYSKVVSQVGQWQGDLGVLAKHKRGKSVYYDLAQRTPDGYRAYFGVTEDGIHGEWRQLVGAED